MGNEDVKNTNFNTLKANVNNLDNKNPDGTNLIHINQYNTEKQNLEEKIGDVNKKKKYQTLVDQWLLLFSMQKLVKLSTKFQILVV